MAGFAVRSSSGRSAGAWAISTADCPVQRNSSATEGSRSASRTAGAREWGGEHAVKEGEEALGGALVVQQAAGEDSSLCMSALGTQLCTLAASYAGTAPHLPLLLDREAYKRSIMHMGGQCAHPTAPAPRASACWAAPARRCATGRTGSRPPRQRWRPRAPRRQTRPATAQRRRAADGWALPTRLAMLSPRQAPWRRYRAT